jgi:hypothetical protein
VVKWLTGCANGDTDATSRNLWRLGVYVWLNLCTLLPGTCAIVVLILVRQSTYLAESCPSPSDVRVVAGLHVNPLFCPPAALIETILQAPMQDITEAVQPPSLQQSARVKARQSSDRDELAKLRVAMADAAVKMATAAQTDAGLPRTPASAQTPQQRALAQRTAEDAQAAFDAGKADLDKATDDQAARSQSRAQAAIFREAKARLRWIASYAAVVVFAIGTIFAGLWITFASLDDHLFPEETLLGEQKRSRVAAGLCLLIGASVLFFRWAWFAIYDESRARLFAGLPPESASDIRLLRFQDAITSFIFGGRPAPAGHLLPNAQPLLEHANWLILFAILALACAVSATLYQRPFHVLPLDNPPDPAEVAVALKNDKDPKPTPQKPYDRVLVRSFQRLNICVYIGATLLVITVINISARYSWIAALLDPTETDEPWKSALPNAINGLAEELALQYGLGFTTLLLGLLIPTWVILRRRAWVVARLRNPGRDDIKTLQQFLSDNGMGFTSVQKYAQVIAVLAPAGAGVFVSALKALTGAAS